VRGAVEQRVAAYAESIRLFCMVRRQRVQTFIRFVLPAIVSIARWMFGKNQRFVCRFEWLTFLPARRRAPHSSQLAMMLSVAGLNGGVRMRAP